METRAQRLAAKVKAVNAAHAVANQVCPKLREFFRQYVGKQVLKAEGGLLKKIQEAMPELPASGPWLHIYRNPSTYSLAWSVKTCEMIVEGGGCLYYEVTIYVANVDGNTIKDIYDNECDFRTDFTTAEVNEKRDAYEAAKKAADTARSNLHPFGEYDN